jgi:uncharacterized phage protein (TIGR01671 family)
MRDIKFRRLLDGKWVYITLHELADNIGVGSGMESPQAGDFAQADEKTTCEYTGLKDKNGKEIYEGDICKDDCGHLSEVKFGKLPLDKSGDCVCTYEAFYMRCYGRLGVAPSYECESIGEWHEVIGNIYQNGELLS